MGPKSEKKYLQLYKNSYKHYNAKYIKSFPINKFELTKAILNNKRNLKKIVSVVHPIVRKQMNVFLKMFGPPGPTF